MSSLNILGGLMIVAMFFAIFLFCARDLGLRDTCYIFGGTIGFICWIVIAAFLITRGL